MIWAKLYPEVVFMGPSTTAEQKDRSKINCELIASRVAVGAEAGAGLTKGWAGLGRAGRAAAFVQCAREGMWRRWAQTRRGSVCLPCGSRVTPQLQGTSHRACGEGEANSLTPRQASLTCR